MLNAALRGDAPRTTRWYERNIPSVHRPKLIVIGAGCARELAARGYKVALLARSKEVEAFAASLGGIGITGSVDRDEDLGRVVDAAMQAYGRIDVVVNNTGAPAKGALLALTDEQWHAGLDLLLLNVVRMARRVAPIMERQGGGAIVNISSFAALEPSLKFPISASLRAALAAFVKLFAEEHTAKGIRMNNVLPGYVETYPIGDDVRARIPAGRSARVEEIAKAVAFLASDDASYITGSILLVDGGISLVR